MSSKSLPPGTRHGETALPKKVAGEICKEHLTSRRRTTSRPTVTRRFDTVASPIDRSVVANLAGKRQPRESVKSLRRLQPTGNSTLQGRKCSQTRLGEAQSVYESPKWDLSVEQPPAGLFGHPDDPNDTSLFQCVVKRMPGGDTGVVGLLARPRGKTTGVVLTCPGAGGGQGPLDPLGGGGGGTYGGYNVFGRLAAFLPNIGIAVILLHYPDGEPNGRPREGGILHTTEHAMALLNWFLDTSSRSLPVGMVGWSMGGAVSIDAAAIAIKARTMNIRCVATIASMKDVLPDSPEVVVGSGADLLLIHNVAGKCNAANSKIIARKAGGLTPVLFQDEDHGVKSAFRVLSTWLPACLPHIGQE